MAALMRLIPFLRWGVRGTASGGGPGGDTDMTFDAETMTWDGATMTWTS